MLLSSLYRSVFDLKLCVFQRFRGRHAMCLFGRDNGIAEGSFLLLASWLKGFVEFVRLRFLVELRCHGLAQAGRIGVSRLSGRVGRLGCGGHGHDAEERQKHCELLSTRLLNILFLAKGECSMSAEKGSAFLLKVR